MKSSLLSIILLGASVIFFSSCGKTDGAADAAAATYSATTVLTAASTGITSSQGALSGAKDITNCNIIQNNGETNIAVTDAEFSLSAFYCATGNFSTNGSTIIGGLTQSLSFFCTMKDAIVFDGVQHDLNAVDGACGLGMDYTAKITSTKLDGQDWDYLIEMTDLSFEATGVLTYKIKGSNGIMAISKSGYTPGSEFSGFSVMMNTATGELLYEQKYYRNQDGGDDAKDHKRLRILGDIASDGAISNVTEFKGIISVIEKGSRGYIATLDADENGIQTTAYNSTNQTALSNFETYTDWTIQNANECIGNCGTLTGISFDNDADVANFTEATSNVSVGYHWFTHLTAPLSYTTVTTDSEQL